ncbi:hypothetical protein RPMA_14335 [Tardiphaga alba]|uniref:Hemolysin XhlA n=1 Tax=Tardiphaga alba TaxID=340268 RepID=A0ABX8A811_9BRAD|nr:hypothetical protein [Tardiphaga alba]QUS39884.1 hypothetical protein RPMA_14335 [Tardiphaga alba]
MADGGGEVLDPMEFRVKRLEDDMSELKTDVKAIRSDMNSLRTDMSYIRGRLDAMPTTIQLLGFLVAIFVASGLTRYFGH